MPDSSQIKIVLKPTEATAAALGTTVEELERRIRRLIAESPKDVAAAIRKAIERNFEQEGNPRWVPLSLYTLRRRKKLGHSDKKILRRTGSLRDMSLRSVKAARNVTTNEAFIFVQPTAPRADVKYNYFWPHQRGAKFSSFVPNAEGGVTRERHIVPRREIVPTGQAARDLADLIVNEILLPKLQKGS